MISKIAPVKITITHKKNIMQMMVYRQFGSGNCRFFILIRFTK